MVKRFERRTRRKRLKGRNQCKKRIRLKFLKETETLARVQAEIQEKILEELEAQAVGRLREEKVSCALQHLKEKREIRDYLRPGVLSYANLIEGVDFIFIYVDSCYKVCRFSVTGQRWIEGDMKRHPEIPVLAIGLRESRESIEQKILSLKNGKGNQSHQ